MRVAKSSDGLDVLHPFHERLRSVVVPELADELRGRDGVGVVTHHPEHENSILFQVIFDELRQGLLLRGVFPDLVHEGEVLLDVPSSVVAVEEPEHPVDDGEGHDGSRECEPEPDEQVNLLVEEIDRKDALDGVPLDVSEPPDLEVAHGDPREPVGGGLILSHEHVSDGVESVHVEILPEEKVECEELTEDGDEEQELAEEVEGGQVVAPLPSAPLETRAREYVLQTQRAAGRHVALVGQIPSTHGEYLLTVNVNWNSYE